MRYRQFEALQFAKLLANLPPWMLQVPTVQ
jgi:hypothetical protein